MLFDQMQQALRVEAWLQHDAAAMAEGEHRVGVGGRVVHWPVHEHDDVGIGSQPIGDGADSIHSASCAGLGRGRVTPLGTPVVPEV